jgi:hypothetical protein
MDIKPPFVIVTDIENSSGMTAMVIHSATVHTCENGNVIITSDNEPVLVSNKFAALKIIQRYELLAHETADLEDK